MKVKLNLDFLIPIYKTGPKLLVAFLLKNKNTVFDMKDVVVHSESSISILDCDSCIWWRFDPKTSLITVDDNLGSVVDDIISNCYKGV